VRERVDFDSFVEGAQVVGEAFGTCLQNVWETTLEGLLPAVRKVFVDWLSAVVGVSKFESATETFKSYSCALKSERPPLPVKTPCRRTTALYVAQYRPPRLLCAPQPWDVGNAALAAASIAVP
jgi:hypothetical protein